MKKIVDLKKEVTELEFDLQSCRDRVRDLEWMIENTADDADLRNDRRRALDKIKYLLTDLKNARLALIERGGE